MNITQPMLKKWINRGSKVHVTENYITNGHTVFIKGLLKINPKTSYFTDVKALQTLASGTTNVETDDSTELETRLNEIFNKNRPLIANRTNILYDNGDGVRFRLFATTDDVQIWVNEFYVEFFSMGLIYAEQEEPEKNALQVGDSKILVMPSIADTTQEDQHYIDLIQQSEKTKPSKRRRRRIM